MARTDLEPTSELEDPCLVLVKTMEVKLEGRADGGPHRCRCCFAVIETGQEIREEDAVTKEVYAQILQDTFNVTLSILESEQICLLCVRRLCDAREFKQLVLDTERRQLELQPGTSKLEADSNIVVKLEPMDDFEDESNWEIDYLDTEDYIDEPVVPKVEKKKKSVSSKRPEGVFRPVEKTMEDMLKRSNRVKAKANLSTLNSLLAKANMEMRRSDYRSSKTLKSLTVKTVKSSKCRDYGKPKVIAKLLTQSKSSALVSKLLAPKIKMEPRRLKIKDMANVGTLMKALNMAKPKKKPISIKVERSDVKVPALEFSEMIMSNKRYERQIVKRNVQHLIEHTTVTPFIQNRGTFKCFFCAEIFFAFPQLFVHVNEVHTNLKKILSKVTTAKDLVCVDITNLKCRKCEQNFPDIDTIKQHLVTEHKVQVDTKHKDDVIQFKLLEEEGFKCHLCDKTYHVFRNLSLHMNEHFPNYMCEVCGKPYISAMRYKIHVTTHETGSYPCNKCGKVFNSVNSRNSHTLEHRPTKYSCPQCGEKFVKYRDRTEHLSQVHQITQRFVCEWPMCGKEFIHRPLYRAHVRTHGHKEKKVECPHCGMRFINNYSLSKHLVTHTGERPFQCKVCGKRYGRKNTLREHMRIHENDRRHVCAECGQAFVQKCSLKGHMKSRHPHVVYQS